MAFDSSGASLTLKNRLISKPEGDPIKVELEVFPPRNLGIEKKRKAQ